MSLIISLKTFFSTNPVTAKLYYVMRKRYVEYDKNKLKKLSKKEKEYSDMSGVAELKNTKHGKRCFIIGNGPSLRISDLDRLKEEDCFGVNRIFHIFDQTEWRPKYYVVADRSVIFEQIPKNLNYLTGCCEQIFLNSCVFPGVSKNDIKENVHFPYINIFDNNKDGSPYFADDIEDQIYHGSTVTYICIQLAVYMGYSEIYLLGIDHNYNIQNKDGKIIQDKNVQNYMAGIEGKIVNVPEMDGSTKAYKKAREVCEAKGIIIKNATRGGRLEEFERIDFDSLVK